MESSIIIGRFNQIKKRFGFKEKTCLNKEYVASILANYTFNELTNKSDDSTVKVTLIDELAIEFSIYDEYVAILDKLMEKEAN